ncbi:hypothetical protein BX661DRAFT_138689 [Kickxella alabastrina]|uniref:uncharacterized protein n=1 Tax=Kickxella alabastrina TaxID=61397 RepID=UPI00222110AD|nr:uncharacterized protein BX661DRAFT_138689 [Kickxella alabastrina]KAI7835224.1 hypothetical protein BX661DRAFT_138689 [Kickxella alabastrina]KAJ1947024.1 NADPH-dependent 1-acyl dihydroxyacetone phosphate reductase [Kickxella alabastrina]
MSSPTHNAKEILPSDERRVVLITGCSAGGIGHYLAAEFAKQGCKVFASARDTSKIDCGLVEKGIENVELDVTKADSIRAAVDRVIQESGHIDILVNNAGLISFGPAVETNIDKVEQIFETNYVSIARMCCAVAPHMMDRRQGTIVNIGSIEGYVSSPWSGHYAASKAAVHTLSDALRIELAPFKVKVVVVAPGATHSNIVDKQINQELVPANSRYAKALDDIRERMVYSQTGASMATSRFVRLVVPHILARQPPVYVTRGGGALTSWLMYYLPSSVCDIIMSQRYGLNKLTIELAAGNYKGARTQTYNPPARLLNILHTTNPLTLLAIIGVGLVVFAYYYAAIYARITTMLFRG